MHDNADDVVFNEVIFHLFIGELATKGVNSPVLGTHMFNTINADYCAE